METNIHSSFIPQDTLIPEAPRTSSRKGAFDLFILIGIVLFVASATLAVGVFLYVQYLQTSGASKIEQLERAKAAFEPALINELTRLDDRMRAADEILGRHIAPTELFRVLEQLTLQTVAFSNFDFEAQPERMTLVMQGIAGSVNAIALQADLLSRSGIISNPIFSNINRQVGGVRFDFSAEIHSDALLFREENPVSEQMPAEQTLTPSPFGSPEDVPAQPEQL